MWKDLSMQQRADLMDIYLSHGVTSLDEMKRHYDSRDIGTVNAYGEGGDIYIRPENRGKFTALKERTGHSATWFKEHGTPAQKKMATFALNARHWKHADGGNLFDGTTENSQQMNRPNIYRYNDGRYVYQAAPDAEEIEVSPINTLLPNPSQWTYQDAEGKVYTPHAAQVDTGIITQDEGTNPLLRAANNYMREAAYRAKDGTLALQGKYTMPAIAANALLPLAGEAFAGSTIAGVPATTWANTALTAGFAGHGLNHAINEGINGWGDAAMTALEIAPLGRLSKPMVEAATPYYNAFKTYLQNEYPAIFDPYTSWDATLGYHGDNIFSRFVGTAGRRFGYTPKAEIPEFHRRLNITKPESFRLTDDGKFIMSSGRTGEGHEGIVNFATSEPARSHNKHKYLSGVDDFIVSPKAFEGVDFKSIQPSDTFFETPLSNTEFAVDPKYITFVSGEPTALDFARSIGMKTLSSPRLRALEADGSTFSGLLSRINNFKGAHSEHARSIGNEIQRLTSMRGAPTMQDYAHFEDMTGLNSGVVPASQWTGTNAIDLFGRESGVRGVPIFNNVAYDPATSIESIYRKAKTGEGTWEAYYDALEKMPSARQQLGLNSAQWTEATAPKITAENAASITPETIRLYHGSPVRFNTFSANFIGSGEGGSKVMRGINLWPEEKIGNAPKLANIKSPDAPMHLGVSSTPLGGELNPTVYDVLGKDLNLYKAAPREVKSLKQEDLVKQGYDGVQTPNQVTVFPESIHKLSIDKQSSIEDFVMSHPEVERWTPWTTDMQKMQNIIDMSRMSKYTPEQWTAAQDAAIARGDMTEAQRLRDLHFQASAPETKAVTPDGQPLALYHGTGKKFNYFDDNKIGTNYLDLGYYGRGHYFTPSKDAAEGYASVNTNPVVYKVYGNFKNPKIISLEDESMIGKAIKNNDSVIAGLDDVDYSEYVAKTGKQIKSADAVTYNNGVRIPLGERDNFNINDIRYGLLPFLGLGAAGALYGKQE